MGSKYQIIRLLIVCIIIGCNSKKKLDFYCDTVIDNSAWRIPIIEPYQLITVDSSTFWNLYCPQTAKYPFKDYSVDSIAYSHNQILLFSNQGNLNNFMLLNSANGKIIDFKSRVAFMEFRSTDSVWSNLYAVKDLFRKYLKSRFLPWSSEIPNYKSCK
jgi:hypothetical protein